MRKGLLYRDFLVIVMITLQINATYHVLLTVPTWR